MLPLEFGFEEPQRVCRRCYTVLLPQQLLLSETRGLHTRSLQDLDLGLDPAPWTWRRCATLPYSGSLLASLQQACYALQNLLGSTGLLGPALCPLSSQAWPPLAACSGVVVCSALRVGWGGGAVLGSGLCVSRRGARGMAAGDAAAGGGGGWSAPCAVSVGGLGWGWQAGVEVCDLVLLCWEDGSSSSTSSDSAGASAGGLLGLLLGAGTGATAGLLGRGGGVYYCCPVAGAGAGAASVGSGGRAVLLAQSKGLYAGKCARPT